MKITQDEFKNLLIEQEEGDKKFYNESAFFYAVKKLLNSQGHDLVKRNMEKDGHMMSAPYYLRDRRWRYCYYDNYYAIADIAKCYNLNKKVTLNYHNLKEM
jgi:hypothetical protein